MRIADYAFLSDCQTAALVGRDGSIDWYCPPRFDAPSVFGRMLDPAGGYWSIGPSGEYRTTRSYLPDSLVLRTEFTTPRGSVALTDALALAPDARGHLIGERVPHELLRRVEGLAGAVEIEMEFAPRPEYGRVEPRCSWRDGHLVAEGERVALTLDCGGPAECDGGAARARFSLGAGQSRTFRLTYRDLSADGPPHSSQPGVATIDDTLEAWGSWSALHQGYDGPYPQAVRTSALVLQGLTYQPLGPVAAAATTSLPEWLGGSWNWDYRFAWLRDAALTMRAEWVAACPDEPVRFFHWIQQARARSGERPVQIVYGVDGEHDLTERTLDHLAGFHGSRPVRIGNDAWRQRQLDVLGEVLDAAHLLRDRLGEFDSDTRDLLVEFADRAANEWRRPDAGMWEARDVERHYTSSKVMCWVALDRAVRLADRLGADSHADRWRRACEDVRSEVLGKAWSDSLGAYAGALDSDELDASVLLLPLVGFLPATDPRMRATISAIDSRLAVDGLVRRWAEEPNGFLICSYWLSECLVMAGDVSAGARLFERITSLANDVGLLAEEAQIGTDDLLGNFPQAFSHVGLINAAWRLAEGGEAARRPEAQARLGGVAATSGG